MDQVSESIIFQGKVHLGKKNLLVLLLLPAIIIILLLGLFCDIEFINDFLDSIFVKIIGGFFLLVAILFPRKLMIKLWSANKTSVAFDLKVIETSPNGFYVAVCNGDDPIVKFEYPFEYTYFRSIAVKTDSGYIYVLHLLLFKDNFTFRISNFSKSSEECPPGWETTRFSLPPDKYLDAEQITEIVNSVNVMSEKYKHLKNNKEAGNVSPFDAIISNFHFNYSPEKNTNTLLGTKEGKYLLKLLKAEDIPQEIVKIESTFFDDLKMSERQFYFLLSSIELEYGINFPRHMLSEIKTVGYLIQLVQHLKEVYD